MVDYQVSRAVLLPHNCSYFKATVLTLHTFNFFASHRSDFAYKFLEPLHYISVTNNSYCVRGGKFVWQQSRNSEDAKSLPLN